MITGHLLLGAKHSHMRFTGQTFYFCSADNYAAEDLGGAHMINRRTIDDQKLFLSKLLRNNGNLRLSCKQTGLVVSQIAKWKEDSPWFAEQYHEVIETMMDDIESDVMRKARKKRKTGVQKFILLNHPEGKKRGYGSKTTVAADVPSWSEMMRRVGEGL